MVRDHPFKTSACLRGGGGLPLPMVADARGVGVLGLPTSAINPQKSGHFYTITLFYFGEYLIDYIIRINNGKFLIILYHTNKK